MINNMKTLAAVIYLMILASFTVGCSSTRLLSSWKAEGEVLEPLKKVMVAGLADNEENRRLLEDNFITAFKSIGVNAIASHIRVDEKEAADGNAITAAARSMGIDRILLVHLVSNQRPQADRQPGSVLEPSSSQYTYGNYYPMVYADVRKPGYFPAHGKVGMESNLYAVDGGKRLWSATTEPVDAADMGKAARQSSKVTVQKLWKDDFIQPAFRINTEYGQIVWR